MAGTYAHHILTHLISSCSIFHLISYVNLVEYHITMSEIFYISLEDFPKNERKQILKGPHYKWSQVAYQRLEVERVAKGAALTEAEILQLIEDTAEKDA